MWIAPSDARYLQDRIRKRRDRSRPVRDLVAHLVDLVIPKRRVKPMIVTRDEMTRRSAPAVTLPATIRGEQAIVAAAWTASCNTANIEAGVRRRLRSDFGTADAALSIGRIDPRQHIGSSPRCIDYPDTED